MRIAKIYNNSIIDYYVTSCKTKRKKQHEKYTYLPEEYKYIDNETGEALTFEEKERRCKEENATQRITEDNRTNGKISNKAKARMKKAVKKFVEAYTVGVYGKKWEIFRKKLLINFVTLTLPARQKHSDYQIKKIALNAFLQKLKNEYSVTAYIWRAEKQENKNIHFHILINRNIKHKIIRCEWNKIINRLGYVNDYKEKMQKLSLNEYIKMRKPKTNEEVKKCILAYNKGKREGWENPNSTDIHKIEKIKNLSAYITKYITKDEKKEGLGVEGHFWGKSENLEDTKEYETELTKKDKIKIVRLIEENKVKEIKRDYVTYYSFVNCSILDFNFSFLDEYLEQCKQNYKQLEYY